MSSATPLISNHAPLAFTASWSPENQHLTEGCLDQFNRCLFGLINYLVCRLILPSLNKNPDYVSNCKQFFHRKWTTPQSDRDQFMVKNFTRTPLELTTPDGVKIEGTYFKNRIAAENAPTVIFFQPNAAISKEGCYDWILQRAALQKIPYNFVYFDYRGTTLDTEPAPKNAQDLYLDGDTVYQFVRDHLHVPIKDIHFYGWSLGGGVEVQVKKIHPECGGRCIIERSYSSILGVIDNVLPSALAFLAKSFVSLLNSNMDSTNAVKSFHRKTLIVHHPKDNMMRDNASLYASIFKQDAYIPLNHIAHLNLSTGQQLPCQIHTAPLAHFSNESFNPEDDVCKFLFASNQTLSQKMMQDFQRGTRDFRNNVYTYVATNFQDGGLYWKSGKDACLGRNGLSISNHELTQAIIEAKYIT